jgi:hypothetical protein
MENCLYSVTIEEALRKVGHDGRYQKLNFLKLFVFFLLYRLYIFGMQFLLEEPNVICEESDAEPCVCDTGTIVFRRSPMKSITEHFTITCELDWMRGMILQITYAGLISGAVLLTWASAFFGRR